MYMQIISQTRDEKLAGYMRLSKRQLPQMLLNSNEALEQRLAHERAPATPLGDTTWRVITPGLTAGGMY